MSEFSSNSKKLQLRILAPTLSDVPSALTNTWIDPKQYADLIHAIQKLRGSVYQEYGPIASQLLADGRHYLHNDAQSWHILLQNAHQQVVGCVRYRPVYGGFEQFSVSQSALARSHRCGPLLRTAIEKDMAAAEDAGMHYVEVGMWALSPEVRCSSAVVNLALGV